MINHAAGIIDRAQHDGEFEGSHDRVLPMEAFLWPLSIGICFAVALYIAGIIMLAAVFVLAQPFLAGGAYKRARQRFLTERASRSDESRTRSENSFTASIQ